MGVQAASAEQAQGISSRSAIGGLEPRRILVHDFAGHPFQVDLSRELANRGHQVLHVYCKTYTSGKGRFDGTTTANLDIVGVPVGEEFARYSPARRIRHELTYGRRFARVAEQFAPDVVIACNVPLVALRSSARWCRRRNVPWVFWLQDLYSRAVSATASQRAGGVGRLVGRRFAALERSLLHQADQVVAITEDFAPVLDDWGLDPASRTVIENWAPLDDLPAQPRRSAWRDEHGLGDRFTYLYSGTLGLKHRPELLYELAAQCRDDADVVVLSEGMGAARLRELQAERELPNLKLLPFQPFERYPEVLGSADVLVALLEPSAGEFSVPSKVLSYLCAGRAVLGAIPPQNLAARTIERAGAGLVTEPTDTEAFLLAAKRLRSDAGLRDACGSDARRYAEVTFDTGAVADRFTAVLHGALSSGDRDQGTVVLP